MNMTAEEARDALYLDREKIKREDWTNGVYWEIDQTSEKTYQVTANTRSELTTWEQVKEFQQVGYSWEKVD